MKIKGPINSTKERGTRSGIRSQPRGFDRDRLLSTGTRRRQIKRLNPHPHPTHPPTQSSSYRLLSGSCRRVLREGAGAQLAGRLNNCFARSYTGLRSCRQCQGLPSNPTIITVVPSGLHPCSALQSLLWISLHLREGVLRLW